jgi:hypothetical protein
MYTAAVVPAKGYAASVWYAPSCVGVKRHVIALEQVQRLMSRMILRAYKSVAMRVLQSEAKLQSVSDRLHECASSRLTKLCSMAPGHPLQRCKSWSLLQGSALPSPLRVVYKKYDIAGAGEGLAHHRSTFVGDAAMADSEGVGIISGHYRGSAAMSLPPLLGRLSVMCGCEDA